MYTEADEKEDTSGPNEKIVDCITSCVHVARASDILGEQKNNLVHVFLVSLAPGIRWTGICLNNIFFPDNLNKIHKNTLI